MYFHYDYPVFPKTINELQTLTYIQKDIYRIPFPMSSTGWIPSPALGIQSRPLTGLVHARQRHVHHKKLVFPKQKNNPLQLSVYIRFSEK